MDKLFKTEVYRDIEKWIASQNALARKKLMSSFLKVIKDLKKKELLTMIVRETLENRVQIVNLPEDWTSQALQGKTVPFQQSFNRILLIIPVDLELLIWNNFNTNLFIARALVKCPSYTSKNDIY